LLASAGRKVILFEKETFPRFHIGESLLPFNLPLFGRLGITDLMDRRFIRKRGAVLFSSDGSVERYVRFADGIVSGHPMAYQVLRSSFDEMLLRNAQRLGASVHQGFTVGEVRCSHRNGCDVTATDKTGTVVRARGRFLLDASGRDAFLATRRGLRRMTPHLRKAAVFAHYTGVKREVGDRAGDIVLVLLRDGWFWMIPLPDGVTSVGLVAEGSRLKECGLPPIELLEESLRRCPAAAERMTDARRVSQVWGASDYSYECKEVAGDGYLLMGDAAAFIDPVFSTGVWLAMSSAELAADALDRALGRDGAPGDLSPAVFARYERKVLHHVKTYTRFVTRFYQPGFMDVFLQPAGPFLIRESVISLLAGLADPPLSVRARHWVFYLLLSLQRRFTYMPPVPLLGVLEQGMDHAFPARDLTRSP